MRACLAIAVAAVGLGCSADPTQRVAGQSDPDGPRTLTADHTVEELVEEGYPTAEGALLCADEAGWTVYGWRVPMNNQQRHWQTKCPAPVTPRTRRSVMTKSTG